MAAVQRFVPAGSSDTWAAICARRAILAGGSPATANACAPHRNQTAAIGNPIEKERRYVLISTNYLHFSS